jgi:WxcM-like, C-terminal
MVGAGSVVTSDVRPHAVVTGNPAHVVRYIDTPHLPSRAGGLAESREHGDGVTPTRIFGVTPHRPGVIEDARGNLSVGEFSRDIPFIPRRHFTIFDGPGFRVRGEHAPRHRDRFLIRVKGSCSIMVDDGAAWREPRREDPGTGVHVPAMIWLTMSGFTPDAVPLVFASTAYDPDDYICAIIATILP